MENKYFKEINGNFGFGCMRLPMQGEEVDLEQFKKMIDYFIESGFNYFDTAHGYINGKSEKAIKECLAQRYERNKFLLANKLTENLFSCEEDIIPFVKEQLEICGVEYFDFYLMHAQNARNFIKYQKCRAYETCFELKNQGYLRHVGISFHDTAEVLDNILSTYPEIEFVQIQYNYLDLENENVQSRKCYEVCCKHNKPVIVMEPVKGGTLVNIPSQAKNVFSKLGSLSPASYAIRFAASKPQVYMVLSGMSDMNQMTDNLSYMIDFKPLNIEEYEAISKVTKIIVDENNVPCTACKYCIAGCPKKINIPEIFSILNSWRVYKNYSAKAKYQELTKEIGTASSCIKCGKCELVCPQKIQIRKILDEAKIEFEG